jgi:hypothetical protein
MYSLHYRIEVLKEVYRLCWLKGRRESPGGARVCCALHIRSITCRRRAAHSLKNFAIYTGHLSEVLDKIGIEVRTRIYRPCECSSALHSFSNTHLLEFASQHSINALLEVWHIIRALILSRPPNYPLSIYPKVACGLPPVAALRRPHIDAIFFQLRDTGDTA